MAQNLALPPPPNSTANLYDWLVKLYYKISNKNHQIITAASAVNLDTNHCQVKTTTASYAITLDPPTLPNVIKTIEMTQRTGAFNVTMALTNVIGSTGGTTTCTWNGTRQYLVLLSQYDKWLVINQYGVTIS